MHYGEVHAVNGIDLRVATGQIFGFLGENGSGKTTTVRMLTTLLKPTAGAAEVGGFDVVSEADAVRQSIGVALQDAGLDPFQTGRELLRLSAQLYNVRGELIEDRISHLLDVINLSGDADRCVGEYSGGMQRRIDLAAALVHGPAIVFLDEPTTGLDPLSRQRLWEYIRRLNLVDGVTFFLTTQYLEEADQLCDEIAILDAGRIVLQDTPQALKDTVSDDVISFEVTAGDRQNAIDRVNALPLVESARGDGVSKVSVYTKSGTDAFPMIVRLLDDIAVSFDHLTLSHATLDDVFLEATGHRMDDTGQAVETDGSR
ncbi:MAG: ATP-binding cassette domain-containing protein [Chloroflexi bacterium]|nr:ATP-binding cassette domain-containing protein [Chloroflexota bacterium]